MGINENGSGVGVEDHGNIAREHYVRKPLRPQHTHLIDRYLDSARRTFETYFQGKSAFASYSLIIGEPAARTGYWMCFCVWERWRNIVVRSVYVAGDLRTFPQVRAPDFVYELNRLWPSYFFTLFPWSARIFPGF